MTGAADGQARAAPLAAPLSAPGGSRPRYALLAQRLIDDIAGERYPVGGLLPTEAALCRLYDVSRFTVREALRRLQALGLVSRQQGVGTRVVARHPARGYTHAMESIDALLQYAERTRLRDPAIGDAVADAALAATLRCPVGQRFLCIEALREDAGDADAPPVCWTSVYIADAYAGIRDAIAGHHGALANLIEARYGETVAEIQQEITAVALDTAIARRLRVAPGAPALRIQRWYLDGDGRIFEISISLHPGARHTYSMRLRRDGAH